MLHVVATIPHVRRSAWENATKHVRGIAKHLLQFDSAFTQEPFLSDSNPLYFMQPWGLGSAG